MRKRLPFDSVRCLSYFRLFVCLFFVTIQDGLLLFGNAYGIVFRHIDYHRVYRREEPAVNQPVCALSPIKSPIQVQITPEDIKLRSHLQFSNAESIGFLSSSVLRFHWMLLSTSSNWYYINFIVTDSFFAYILQCLRVIFTVVLHECLPIFSLKRGKDLVLWYLGSLLYKRR